ncbi:NAD(P)/FAD-dependent oxidoreductase [Synechococcus sp. PCC 6312]|uniref:NAD(P)/FAD-dependent oxidoreductase n=1 Tax=Synechococcus sp. (strain ATCC 27167 / PCC 6312) TaxID=195253 RepID=UPI00029EE104|nr:NAD(P)/FAD-dependent oxidoreductase [Synechococcus sp. PCC 6312]AFY62483.1 NADH dehydrogenase, FAD-containing subunit [Synechococcus sp. PCC 6312]
MGKKVVILGGGFGGLYTALRLGQLPWEDEATPEITLVDQADRFLFTPFLYELLTGELETWEIAPPFSEILADTPIQFCQAQVSHINLVEKLIALSPQATLAYDYLVLALGGTTPTGQVPGVTDHALMFRTLADAYTLGERLKTLENSRQDKIRIVIVGAGPSGVELACKLSERLGNRGRIRLVDRNSQILGGSPSFNQETAQRALEERQVWLDLDTTPEWLSANTIALKYKDQVDELPVDLVIWTVGTEVAGAIQALELPKNERGRILTTPTLQVMDYPDLFALGDLADVRDQTGQQVPTTAQAAFQEADYVGWNVWASLNHRPLLPFSYSHLGEMLTLGTDSAALAGLGLQLDGSLAYLVRRLAYLYRMPTLEHQLKVGAKWVLSPLMDLLTTGV